MESHPKVMTVSYGTFSCTLEGFDDPFTTMQLVAEYFRKLAKGDRYFGGEPLQPDHNALHQIAKDANPYRVDAEVTDTGITLRKANVLDAEQRAQEAVARAEPAAPVQTSAPPADTPQVDAPQAEEPAAKAPTPLFASTRAISAQRQAQAATAPAKPAATEKEESPFVEAAIFSSRRGALSAAKSEPALPASALLSAEEDEDDDENTFAFDDTGLNVFEEETPVGVKPENDAQPSELDQEAAERQAAEEEAALVAEEEAAIRYRLDAEDAAKAVSQILAVENADEIAKDEIKREEAALERLLETTNSKLETTAHSRKSNALERLKAAVAATEAERRLRAAPAGTPATRTERPKVQDLKVDAGEFKSRMSKVRREHEESVQMTRPVAKSNTPRARSSIATLILGKDQRIAPTDAAEAADSVKKPEADGPSLADASQSGAQRPELKIVRPALKPEAELLAETPLDGGFETFARKIGANTLHELLEASAAYLSIVENEPRFSQERIIETIGDYMAENNISEDAANRSLNRLMRDGRILRVKQDSYTISKSARHGFQDRMAG
nr:hypothetical protein [Amylibacter sp.]